MSIRIVISVIIVLFLFQKLYGQEKDSSNFQQDTSLTVISSEQSDTANSLFQMDEIRTEAFYDTLAQRANKRKWSSQLHQLVVKHLATKNSVRNEHNAEEYFEQFENKYIRNINITQLDVFGPSVSDTTQKTTNWLQKVGNTLHISTNRSSIESFLFINENEKLDPFLLADNERVLRRIPNIQDARIFVFPINDCADSVDLQVVTKDVWPFGTSLEMLDVTYGNASVWNTNLLGLGHQIYFKGYFDENRDPQYGYLARYSVPNIFNSFISADFSHEDKWKYLANKAHINRFFLTPATRVGFGAGYENIVSNINHSTLDSTLHNRDLNYEYYHYWLGYSLPLGNITEQRIRKNLFVTSRLQDYVFFNSPEVNSNYLHEFTNRKIYLASLGFTWQGYYSTRLILGFGDTEDLPYGAMIKFTGGKEFGEFNNRLYLGTTFSFSNYFEKAGYLSNEIQFAGYYHKPNIEQGLIKFKSSYISPIFGNDRHLFRNFIRLDYTQGYNRFEDEFVDIRNNRGIRGLQYFELKGNKKAVINSEWVYYSPQYIYGFRFVYFAFMDAGLVNYQKNVLIKNPVHASVGFGVRIRNERLVFNTIQLQLNLFPFSNEIPNENKRFVDLTGRPKVQIPEFANQIPEIIEY
ncbi:MAG: hypothetical protein JXA77_10430 [Bacteroidales bacterium]|nr:hypothetical protein [Bacteroidales bacterium]MBN2817880.1 hypothetical protein [Bacteroidales bacterium]